MKYTIGYVDEKMTKEQEKLLAIDLLDKGFVWLGDFYCRVVSIERNERHYFLNYEDRISSEPTIKKVCVSQLKGEL